MPLEPFVIEDGDWLTGFSVDLWDSVAMSGLIADGSLSLTL